MQHYLYRHIRLDKYEPFYIGIGTRINNCDISRANRISGRNLIWKRIVKKSNYKVEILLESDNYNFIKEKEIEFIKLYGRKNIRTGTLANLTDGGEGTKGHIKTKEVREILRLKNVGKKLSEEHKQKISLNSSRHNLGKKFSEETRKKISESRKKESFIFPEKAKVTQFKKGQKSIRSLKIQDLKTGIIYESITEAANKLKLNRRTLTSRLNGKLKNNTNLIKI